MPYERSDALATMAQRRFVPFHYERESQTFHFADEVKGIDEIPAYGVLHRAGGDLDTTDSERLLSTVAFASSFNRLHSLPLADIFFQKAWNGTLLNETNEVMYEAYVAAKATDTSGDSWGSGRPSRNEFSTVPYLQEEDPSGHAGVFLQTRGICACTKPEAHPDVTYHPLGVMTYVEHNVPTSLERTSLLAGLGHIARRANEYVR